MIILDHFPEVSKYWILVAPLYWLIGEPDKKRSCPIKLNYPGQQSQPSALSFVILIFWSHLDSLCSSDTSPAPGYTRQGLLLWSPTTDFFLLTPLWGIYSCWPVVWLLGKTKTLSGLSGCHRVNAPQTSTAFLFSPASSDYKQIRSGLILQSHSSVSRQRRSVCKYILFIRCQIILKEIISVFSIGNEQTGSYPGILTPNLRLHIRHLTMIHFVLRLEILYWVEEEVCSWWSVSGR